MDAEQLRQLQAPWKQRFRDEPAAACQTLTAEGRLDAAEIVCHVRSFEGEVPAGLHPATGGTAAHACSAAMLLEALVGCAGVTLKAVSTALETPLKDVRITAEGDLDFRGTLGVDKTAPVGLTAIRLTFDVADEIAPEVLQKLISLTERYCVVLQTLQAGTQVETLITGCEAGA